MAAQHQICPGLCPDPRGIRVATQQVGSFATQGNRRGLVYHHHTQLLRPGGGQQAGHPRNLCPRYLPVLVSPCASGVDAHHQAIRRAVHGFHIRPEHGGKTPVGPGQPCPQVEQRNVVVAWNDHRRYAQPVHEGPGRPKLFGPGALRDVTREHHHVGLLLRCKGRQRLNNERLLGAEMCVGQVQQHTHVPAPGPLAVAAAPWAWSRYRGLSSTRMSMGERMRATSPSNATTTSLRDGASLGLTTMW